MKKLDPGQLFPVDLDLAARGGIPGARVVAAAQRFEQDARGRQQFVGGAFQVIPEFFGQTEIVMEKRLPQGA